MPDGGQIEDVHAGFERHSAIERKFASKAHTQLFQMVAFRPRFPKLPKAGIAKDVAFNRQCPATDGSSIQMSVPATRSGRPTLSKPPARPEVRP